MKFLHIADLHFGKTIHGVSLIESGDQPAWADRFLALAADIKPDAVLIAGDVYDRSSPSGDAVELLSRFLTGLVNLGIPVLMIAGNHDSGQRLSFGGELLARANLHIAGGLGKGGSIPRVTLRDEFGPVNFYLMPYIFPALAQEALGDAEIRDYDAAVRRILAAQDIHADERNVILAHQNVTAGGAKPEQGGSESMVGGLGQVDYTAFDMFDYAALGHIHAAYPVGRPEVRFAGSPLCYHFNETKQAKKGPLLVTMGEKGEELTIETLAITPLHPMREMKGSYEELRDELLSSEARGEYLRIVVTDQRITPETSGFLRELCESRESVLMELTSEFSEFSGTAGAAEMEMLRERSLSELFSGFYAERSGGAEIDEGDLHFLKCAEELAGRADINEKPSEADVLRLLGELIGKEAEV